MAKYKQVAGGKMNGQIITIPGGRTCDLCGRKDLAGYVDGKINRGPWAIMCMFTSR